MLKEEQRWSPLSQSTPDRNGKATKCAQVDSRFTIPVSFQDQTKTKTGKQLCWCRLISYDSTWCFAWLSGFLLASLGSTWFHVMPLDFIWWVSLGFTWLHLVSLDFICFHAVSLRDIWFHLNSLGFSWSHSVPPGLTRLDLIALDHTWFRLVPLVSLVSTWLHLVSFEVTRLHLISVDFTWLHLFISWVSVHFGWFSWFHLASPGSTWVHSISLDFTWSVSFEFNWFHSVLLHFTWVCFLSPVPPTWSHLVSLGFTWFRLDKLGFIRFPLVSLCFTWLHLVLLGITRLHLISIDCHFTDLTEKSELPSQRETGKLPLGKRVKGKGGRIRFSCGVLLTSRNPAAHARTKRNDFPVWKGLGYLKANSFPPNSDIYIYIIYIHERGMVLVLLCCFTRTFVLCRVLAYVHQHWCPKLCQAH